MASDEPKTIPLPNTEQCCEESEKPTATQQDANVDSTRPPDLLTQAETNPWTFKHRVVSVTDQIWGDPHESFWDKHMNDVEAKLNNANDWDFIEKLNKKLRKEIAGGRTPMLAFDKDRSPLGVKFVLVTSKSDEVVWFIGDLHGDLLAWLTLLEYIRRVEKRPIDAGNYKVCILGDIIDGGPHSGELLALMLNSMIESPGNFAFVTGNHDEGLRKDKRTTQFCSTVSPSDFCELLYTMPPTKSARKGRIKMRRLAHTAIQFFQQAPRALLFPDGLLVAHGGVPHIDLHKDLRDPADFNHKQMLDDFVWTRIHESARHKIPNRTTRGCSLGFEDFDKFCDHARNILGKPVLAMLRGHDHVPERFLVHESYRRHPVITINAMCSKQREVFGPWERMPVAVRWQTGLPLEIHQIEIPVALIDHFHPRPLQGSEAVSRMPPYTGT